MTTEDGSDWGRIFWAALFTGDYQDALQSELAGHTGSPRYRAAELHQRRGDLAVYLPGRICIGTVSAEGLKELGVGYRGSHIRDGDAIVCRLTAFEAEGRIEAEIAIPPRRSWWQTK